MSGYKRVNFYELCRLCATNQQKDKTHIFQEEGRKIQLQTKIQSCLSLTVCENDFLPKVVCSKCLRTLEVCYTFRQECVSSESMLSSYFKNFRYTDDFKKSGKVYIKDTTTTSTTIQKCSMPPPPPPPSQYQINSDQINIPTTVSTTTTTPTATTTTQTTNQTTTIEHLPFYTLQIPTIMAATTATTTTSTTTIKNELKTIQNNQTTSTTNINNQPITTTTIKTNKLNDCVGNNNGLSNVVVNANGEVLHIAQLVDFDSIINQTNLHKIKNNNNNNNNNHKRKFKEEEGVVKIDLTNSDIENSFDKTANNNVKSSKFNGYSIKIEDNNNSNNSNNNNKTPVIFSNLNDFHSNFNGYNAAIYQSNLQQTIEPSTVNLNVLNSDFNKIPTTATTTATTALTTTQTTTTKDNLNEQQQLVKVHVCEICQKSFKRREHLYQHVKLHTGFRPYTCENCNKSFMRKEHLLRHMTSHSGLKNFTCNICDKSFSRNDNLLKHKKTHDKQNNYMCEICQKQFVMKHYYLAHKLTHDNSGNNGNNGVNIVATTSTTTNVWNVLKT